MNKKISIIAQCYNEEKTLKHYYKEMNTIMNKMDYIDFELIFIDDASRDNSRKIIKELVKKDKRVKYIFMSRNFGREACMMAGFKYATGDYLTTMDIDLQDPPKLLIKMEKALSEGYDIAAAKATSRKGYSLIHRLCIKAYYKIINKISNTKMIDGQREYRLMNRKVINAILEHKEYNLFNKALLNDVGFKIKWIEYENEERIAGKTKFNFKRMVNYSIKGIVAYSNFPLILLIYLGLISKVASLLTFIIFLVNKNIYLLITSLFTLLLGVILLSSGILGLYIYQIHLEVKNRPLYLIDETNLKISK